MTTTKMLKSLLIAALLASTAAAYADQSPIQVAIEDGKTIAQFKVGDSHCVLIDDKIRCTRVTK
jgi:serine/threonine protein phosphatase PrpC